jgi:hypothetical protein
MGRDCGHPLEVRSWRSARESPGCVECLTRAGVVGSFRLEIAEHGLGVGDSEESDGPELIEGQVEVAAR